MDLKPGDITKTLESKEFVENLHIIMPVTCKIQMICIIRKVAYGYLVVVLVEVSACLNDTNFLQEDTHYCSEQKQILT